MYHNNDICGGVKSKGAEKCRRVLDKYNISYEREVTLDSLPNRRFDFWFELDGIQYLLEIDGKQHFEYTPFFHDDDPSIFKNMQKRDVKKTLAAIKAGYFMIRIDYTQIKTMKDIEYHINNAIQHGYNGGRLYFSDPKMYQFIIENL